MEWIGVGHERTDGNFRSVRLESGGGGFGVVVVSGAGDVDPQFIQSGGFWRGVALPHERIEYGTGGWDRTWLGFGMTTLRLPIRRMDGVIVPAWFVLLVFAALPVHRFARRLRGRQPPGHCPACGYDLRATPERCPECGTPVSLYVCGQN